ncbi:hypothetical protein GE09DRAFT_302954 [Coniochaeta sp. 2T2.1]|nr:hypothetical protein GE09DRAFT_302954 [Coniochaeta sp. 2T2.1]
MLPPVDDAVLQNNPDFATLYNTLTTAVLNPNGSTKNDPARKEREAVRDALKSHRKKTIKHHLLITSLSTAVPTPTATTKPTLRRPRGAPQPAPSASFTLPPELFDLILLLPPFLSNTTPLDTESASLLLSNPPFTTLPSLLPQLTPHISSSLISQAAALARLLHPSTNPSFIHRTVPSLPTTTTTLLSSLSDTHLSLSRQRLESSVALTRLLSLRASELEQLIRALESKHGNVARSLELRAAEVAVLAARQEYTAGVLLKTVRREVYTPEVIRALERYGGHLRDGKGRLREEIRGLMGELGRYGVRIDTGIDGRGGGEGDEAKERTMREMARVYREMGRQVEEVRGDLERLGRA